MLITLENVKQCSLHNYEVWSAIRTIVNKDGIYGGRSCFLIIYSFFVAHVVLSSINNLIKLHYSESTWVYPAGVCVSSRGILPASSLQWNIYCRVHLLNINRCIRIWSIFNSSCFLFFIAPPPLLRLCLFLFLKDYTEIISSGVLC